jgi:DUF971 family protein
VRRYMPARHIEPGDRFIAALRYSTASQFSLVAPAGNFALIASWSGLMASEPVRSARSWPTEIRLRKDKAALRVAFETGEAFEFPAEFLRVYSPSAEVQGHSPDERKTVGGKRDVKVLEVHPVGNYAVRLVFDDMHSTGIFSWDYFLKLGHGQERMWHDYIGELAAKGHTRDPPRRT